MEHGSRSCGKPPPTLHSPVRNLYQYYPNNTKAKTVLLPIRPAQAHAHLVMPDPMVNRLFTADHSDESKVRKTKSIPM